MAMPDVKCCECERSGVPLLEGGFGPICEACSAQSSFAWMNRPRILQAWQFRQQGFTFKEIGKRMGYGAQRAQAVVSHYEWMKKSLFSSAAN